jgi:alpha,alpha-trehalase
MDDPHLAALEITLTPEDWSGPVEFRTALDGTVINAGVARYRHLSSSHLEPLETAGVGEDTLYLKLLTSQSELAVAQAARTEAFTGDAPLHAERHLEERAGFVAHQFTLSLEPGQTVHLEKTLALFTSRDRAISECGLAARTAVAQAGRFAELLERHSLAWELLWRRFDIEVESAHQEGGERMGLILHLHVFHLLQTVSMHTMDLDVGVPARGWHGEAYRGHVFWDELFILPFLTLRVPEVTRSLLMYRYRRLGAARIGAREAGYAGAMYPWQSGSSGREESQVLHLNPRSGRWIPDHTRLQRHVSAAVAYNIWQYYQTTRDAEFLCFYGAEMLLEIARFWASIASWNAERERYEIRGVMGPDEYHDASPEAEQPGLNNNAYTNLMAVWVLCRALELLDLLPADRRRELCETLDLRRAEIDRWQEISRRMLVPFHDDGIISQFEGYESLRPLQWDRYREDHGDSMRLDRILEAEGDTPNRYQASKQADVLMLCYLFSSEALGELFARLGYPFGYDTIPRNIAYYLPRSSHGSTLSKVVHAWVLTRSDRARSWKLFNEALESDVADVQGGTTPEGIHLGAMAGTVDLVQRAYTGLEVRGDVLWLNPCLPAEVARLQMRIRYRGHALELDITRARLTVRCPECAAPPVQIGFKGAVRELRGDQTIDFTLG